MAWMLVATRTEPWPTGEARADQTWDDYRTAEAAFVDDMVTLGVHPWQASSPRDIGYLRRVWWRGPIGTGEMVAGWEPWQTGPPAEDCRQVTIRELCGEFFRVAP